MPTFEEYLIDMAAYARLQTPELTDLQPGSVMRSLLEIMAAQIETAYYSAYDQTQQAITESAYRIWEFDRRPARAAYGIVRFTATAQIDTAIAIPAGTVVRVPNTARIYRTQAAATFPSGPIGTTLEVPILAIGTGKLYNTPAGTIIEIGSALSGLSVTNPAAIVTGADAETDEERLQRFATFVRSFHRASASAVEYAAEQAVITDPASGIVIERVMSARARDVSAGVAICYVSNGSGNAPSAALLSAADALVQAYKAAGVQMTTSAAALNLASVAVEVLPAANYTLTMVQTSVRDRVRAFFDDLGIGEPLYLERLISAILEVPGIVTLNLIAPADDVAAAEDEEIALNGNPTVTEMVL